MSRATALGSGKRKKGTGYFSDKVIITVGTIGVSIGAITHLPPETLPYAGPRKVVIARVTVRLCLLHFNNHLLK